MTNYDPVEIGNLVVWFGEIKEKYWIGTVISIAGKDSYNILWSNGKQSTESLTQVLAYRINLDYLIKRQERYL